ncbi:hypothetical protein ESCO_005592 [Escovopsis weberi]|uniref:Uncharacterized protein n=1 Tax=Escovopsis weberi TaxID=150374 RepID=A0A0M8N3Q4_ESCWE|nr:hypothetical protein ESCO_005592 [Escovopsis weberi]
MAVLNQASFASVPKGQSKGSELHASEYDQWTTNQADLDKDFYWAADGQGALTAASYGLTNAAQIVPQMIKRPSYGSDAYIFTYAGKCYLWNMISDQVFEYTQPTTYEQVVAEMKKPHGTGVTKMKLAEQKPSS